MAVSLDFQCVRVFVNTPVMAPTKLIYLPFCAFLHFACLLPRSTFFSILRTSFWQMTYVSSWFVRQRSSMLSPPVGRSSWNDSTRTKMLSEEHTTQVMKEFIASSDCKKKDLAGVSRFTWQLSWQHSWTDG